MKKMVGQKVKALRDEIMTENIRKATGREIYSEIYKPITEGIDSQKEELSSQLKALPGIKEQLSSLPKSITGLTKGLQEAEKSKTQEYIPVDWGDEPVEWVPQDEFKKLEHYGNKQIGITGKPLPPEKIMTEEEISQLSKEEISELQETYVPIYTEDESIIFLSKEKIIKLEHKDWDADDEIRNGKGTHRYHSYNESDCFDNMSI
ncbi:uncharacterized protein LOC123548825 isoform X1 [Mercenaria mercenaria]|uniref:uncharacterized protein LOC123548825 isoform X1 n=1 Tax=Mercenaria mercenaria TaxID=6596 RepID=UPI00234F1C2E|nr:uncharacterized protein LOC123548825 isoform X1 [Mercenaria mercenaria]